MINYSQLKEKLNPDRDGQDVLQLRVGVVTAINSDGTADVTVNGVTVPKVTRLAEASVTVGVVVQMLSYRGSLMIIGRVSTSAQSAGLGLWARGQSTSNSGTLPLPASAAGLIGSNVVTFVKGRAYEVKMHGAISTTSANAWASFLIYRKGPATQIGDFYKFPAPATGQNYNVSASGFYFQVSANVTDGIDLYGGGSTAGIITHVGSSSTPRNIEVYDVGDVSQYAGITTW